MQANQQPTTQATVSIPTVRRGDKGTATEIVQRLLKYVHGNPITIDSDFGSQTESAVKDFQSFRAIPVTGVVNLETWKALATQD
ncbi:MAG: peptidoglycan-binding protein [Fischerella sp. CENA71]|nr:peptidoglycan-binding protein [Fischerella sp. CENA71]